MVNFDVSKEWVILLPPEIGAAKKAAEDLSRYIGLLAVSAGKQNPKRPLVADPSCGLYSETVIILNSEGRGPEWNGFTWRAGGERVEIFGESGRGLCNGIYSFLSALGISWPAPCAEILPVPVPANPVGTAGGLEPCFSLTDNSAREPSNYSGSGAAPWRRFVPAGMRTVKKIFKKGEAFADWAARRRYDILVFPLRAFASNTARKLKELKKHAAMYGIALEAGGRDLGALVPRKYFFLHKDFFRMKDGRRTKDHHFCPTNPGAIALVEKEGGKLFRSAGEITGFQLWPAKGAESAWCSCPSCRAFTPEEQNRIAVNTAADTLSRVNPRASLGFFEKPGEGGKIPLRKNLVKMERLPEEKEIR